MKFTGGKKPVPRPPRPPWWKAFVVLPFVIATVRGQPARKPAYTTWSEYGGASDSMQYSALTRINKANVSRLEQAWFFPVPDKKGNFGFNPIVVDGVMYLLGPSNAIVAADAVTGKRLWAHVVEDGTPGNRGITYWESKDRVDRRLIFGAGGTLREIARAPANRSRHSAPTAA